MSHESSVGHGAKLQVKDPLLALRSRGRCYRRAVLIGQKKAVSLPASPPERSRELLAMLREVHYCLSLLFDHSA